MARSGSVNTYAAFVASNSACGGVGYGGLPYVLQGWCISVLTNLVLQLVLLRKVQAVGRDVKWMRLVVLAELALAIAMGVVVSDKKNLVQTIWYLNGTVSTKPDYLNPLMGMFAVLFTLDTSFTIWVTYVFYGSVQDLRRKV